MENPAIVNQQHGQYFELQPSRHFNSKISIPTISIIAPANLSQSTESSSSYFDANKVREQQHRRRGFPVTAASTSSIDRSNNKRDVEPQPKPFGLNLLQVEAPRRNSISQELNTQSAWWLWTQRRRSSFVRRQNTAPKNNNVPRVSTPIIKAREESIKFVAAELKADHITAEDSERRARELRRQRASVQAQSRRKGTRGKCKGHHEMEKLTINEWNKLIVYWEHPLFVKLRAISILSVFLSFILGIVAISAPGWTNHEIDGDILYSGLWVNCFSQNNSCYDFFTLYFNNIDGQYWQKAVIGLLIFSIAFAFVGSILSVAGVCSQYIPKKMYYYHSSGEMFFVSAVAATVALAIYPYMVSNILMYRKYSFGYGYGLAWAAAALLYVSAFTMMMDELIRESTRKRMRKLCNIREKFDRYQSRPPSAPQEQV